MPEARYPSLQGRHVLVTGGGSGIGEALVRAFVAQGARVSFIDVLDVSIPDARGVQCDLADLTALERALTDIAAERGPVEVLVNNAASDDRHSIAEITPAYFDDRIAVNLRHFIFTTQALLPAMRAAKRGVIINMGSISWHLGLPDLVLYETAKAGIEGFTRALAREVGPDGVRAVCVLPGNVQTPRQQKWYSPEGEAEILRNQCLSLRIQPDDVAALVAFLASDDARCCTGHNYWVDAGWR